MMPDKHNPLQPKRREEQVWATLRRAPPTTIAIGGIGTVVGLLTGQPVGAIAIYVMVMLVGAILLLVLRWR